MKVMMEGIETPEEYELGQLQERFENEHPKLAETLGLYRNHEEILQEAQDYVSILNPQPRYTITNNS